MPGPSGTQIRQPMSQKHSSGAARAGIVENFAVCMSNSPSEIWLNIHLVFYPTGSSTKKRKRQATTDPDSKPRSSSDSESSSTVNTSNSEGKDEKDFILPDYPSDELTFSDSSDSELEDAFAENACAENLSTGWSERVKQSNPLHTSTRQKLQACRCSRAESIPRPETSDGEVHDQAAV